jgi:acetyl-CoA carboxylase alpha subunit
MNLQVRSIKNKLRSALEELSQYEIDYLLEARYAKFRKIGVFKEG